MAYVISVAGAGGKTSLIFELAYFYAGQGKKCVITTTTHMWEIQNAASLPFHVCASSAIGHKISYPGDLVFSRLCSEYDVVLVEADGAKSRPMKLPRDNEPVIPKETNKIIIVMGAHAIGRSVQEACFANNNRYDSSIIITEDFLKDAAYCWYINPLEKLYPKAQIEYHLSNMFSNPPSTDKITFVLMASGSGKRFGSNKLLADFKGKKLYRHMYDKLESLTNHKDFLDRNIKITLVTVSPYNEIASDIPNVLPNPNALEGISSSIHIGTKAAISNGSGAVVFFVADMPHLPRKDIKNFLLQFIYSHKSFSCMDNGESLSNPGAFLLQEEVKEALLSLTGDSGAMKVIKNDLSKAHIYPIAPEKLRDIDTPLDLW